MNSHIIGHENGSFRARSRRWTARGAFALTPLLALALTLFNHSLQSQELQITEFLAANYSGEKDEDGEYQDWIEIFNPAAAPASLEGWFLSDDAGHLSRWRFPSVTLPGRGFLVVFASGQDRTNSQSRFHTNFKMGRNGEYLALIKPDGQTVASVFSPAYPRQLSDVSYGMAMSVTSTLFVPTNASCRLWVAADSHLESWWNREDFNDLDWTPATLGLGYDRSSATEPDPAPLVADVSQPGDFIVGTSGNSPGNEGVENAIDNATSTKYLNFDKLNAGFTLTPSAGDSIVTGLRLTSANDAPERDPTSYQLLGSRDGLEFIEVAHGPIPAFPARFKPVEVWFTNTTAYQHYRLLFPTVKNATAAVAVQIAEVELLGRIGPAPPEFASLIQTSVENLLFSRQTSLYARIPFVVPELHPWPNLALMVRFDDGFVAFLNGVEVARKNAPLALAWNAAATTNRWRASAVMEERFDLSPFGHLLHPGTNLLAIQALNDRADSPDFLLQVALENSDLSLGSPGYFSVPTPGRPNGAASPGLVDEVTVNPQRGFFESATEVSLHCTTPDTIIRYTTNNSIPSATNGTVYTNPLLLARTTTLRAAAFREGWHPSRTATHTYLLLDDVITQTTASTLAAGFPAAWNGQTADYGLDRRMVGPAGQDNYGGKYARSLKSDLQAIPTLSLVMDMNDMFGAQGIYSNPQNHGAAWERGVSLELLYPDGRRGFQEDAGIRIQGGAFRRFDLSLKKSFRVIFTEKYGSSTLRYPLFGDQAATEFNNLVLRANSNDGWPYFGARCLYVRDTFAMETARAMSLTASHSTFVHLYINGAYWGLYNPVERPDASFSASYRGGQRETWDAINQDSVPDGNYDAWNRMLGLLAQGMVNHDLYQRIQGNDPDGRRNPAYEDLLDVDNMIDYMILNFYAGNTDWPHRNWWVGRDRNNGDGFHFYPWDTETALGVSGVDVDVTGAGTAVAAPYAAARANPDFRVRFADHVYRHFFNGGALYVNPTSTAWNPALPENNRPAERFAAIADQIRSAIVGESARWGDQKGSGPFTRDEHWQKERDNLLANFFPKRSSIVLGQLRRAGLYPTLDPPTMNQRGGLVPSGFQLELSSLQGTIYYTTNGADPRLAVANQEISRRYTSPITLTDLTTLKARIFNGQEWSALNEATFVVGSPRLVLSELDYHPADPSAAERAAGFSDADSFEFVELFNDGVGTFDLQGCRFAAGIRFEFGNTTFTNLASGQYLLVVKNRAAFAARYGSGLPVAGEYSGQLDNAGEPIQLVNTLGEVILNFAYGTNPPWPKSADGAGSSLEVVDPRGDLSAAANWRASSAIGGSPGRANPLPRFAITRISHSDNTVRFSFPGMAHLGYTLYTRDSFDNDSWHILQQGPALPQDQTVEITVELPAQSATRFLRISIP